MGEKMPDMGGPKTPKNEISEKELENDFFEQIRFRAEENRFNWVEVDFLSNMPKSASTWAELAEKIKLACPELEVKVEEEDFVNSAVKVRKN